MGLLVGVILALKALAFVVAPMSQLWLPMGVSTYSGGVDSLFYIILAVIEDHLHWRQRRVHLRPVQVRP